MHIVHVHLFAAASYVRFVYLVGIAIEEGHPCFLAECMEHVIRHIAVLVYF